MHHILYHSKAQDSISDKCWCVVILTVILSSEYFGGNVIRGAAESACCIAWSQTLLQKPKRSSATVRSFPTAVNRHLSSSAGAFIQSAFWLHESLDHTLIGKPHLAHAVVCQFDMSLRIQQNVVQFQISVDDSPLVEVVERQTDLC